MSSGKNPLMLMMALSMPGAAHALGLGDIHVNSGLNERLAAEIDIVGATALELAGLRAAVANRETFLRYGADRPAFLSSATFKVTRDREGRPVLTVRSTESFTEPVVNLLVDLNWGNGELVRQYTLLLDPAGFASAPPTPVAPEIPATPEVLAAPAAATPTDQANPASAERAVRKTTHIKVGAKATLRGVAWRVGERSNSDLQRMMIAIFRANPNAFDGNINRLHLGAVLTIPSHAEAAEISKTEAKREVHAQMAAWRSPVRAPAASSAKLAPPVPATAEAEGLDRRVQSLEQELGEMKGLLQSEHQQLLGMQQQAVRAAKPAPVAEMPRAVNAPQAANAPLPANAPPSKPGYSTLVSIVAGLGILAAVLAALYFRLRRRAPTSKISGGDSDVVSADGMADTLLDGRQEQEPAQEPTPESAHEGAHDRTSDGAQPSARPIDPAHVDDATHPMLPIIRTAEPAGRSEIVSGTLPHDAPQDATVNLHVDTVNMRVDSTRLDYNLLDLDLTAQHVQMPSVLNEDAVTKERRTNLADVLKLAIEREPDRHDLRLKLLELYYSAAATNRKAFLEVVQKLARDRGHLQADQWNKIAYMGRQIASDNPLFAEESPVDDDLANCA
jgi:pilus assembly protein FimV